MLNGLSIRYFLLSCFILFFESNSVFARSSMQSVFTFTAGASISQLGQSQSFAPLDLCKYTYKPKESNTTNMLWGGFIGSEVKRSSSWRFIGGLGYYQPNVLPTRGTLTQGADSTSDNIYSYKYQTQSQQLLVESKLYWIKKERIQPFLMLGIGAAFNKMFDYQTSVPPFLEFTPAFSNHSQTNFTYAVGPGIDISLSKSFRAGILYRLTDLGAANIGSAQINTIPISSTLKQSHLYANQVLAQFTYTPQTH